MNQPDKREKLRNVPTVIAAGMALLASTTGINATSSQQNPVPPVPTAKRQNDDESTPTLVLVPSFLLDTLIAGHSSHASHASHYSGASDNNTNAAPVAPTPPPATPPSVAPPAPAPTPPPATPSTATQLDQSVLDKLAQLPAFWPKKVALIRAFSFTMIHDGIAAGHLDAPVGTLVDLVAVKGSILVVSLLDNKAEVPASITDIGDRVNVSAIVAAPYPTPPPSPTNVAPVAPVPPATSPATPPQ